MSYPLSLPCRPLSSRFVVPIHRSHAATHLYASYASVHLRGPHTSAQIHSKSSVRTVSSMHSYTGMAISSLNQADTIPDERKDGPSFLPSSSAVTSSAPASASASASSSSSASEMKASVEALVTRSSRFPTKITTATAPTRRPSTSPHFTPLPADKLPHSPIMQKRYQHQQHYQALQQHQNQHQPQSRSQAYPSPSPDPEINEGHFSEKVLQAEERWISKELKVKHSGQGRFVRIVEVSARDGLQNLPGPAVPTELKRELVERLLHAGVRNIEVGSFVRGDWVPQMADTPKLLPLLPPLTGQSLSLPSPPASRPGSPSSSPSDVASASNPALDRLVGPGPSSLKHIIDASVLPASAGMVHYPVLVPNMRGLDNLVKLEREWQGGGGQRLTDEIAVFVSATEAFSQANNHAPLSKILSSLPPVVSKATELGYRVRGYVSCVITCPYSGPTEPAEVVDVAKKLIAMGCYEISLGDTTGEGDPTSWSRLWGAMRDGGVDMSRVAAHCHDTFSLALSSLCTLLPSGLSSIDSSLAGLGGCPYSPGATGNVPTEDVVYTLHKLGYETGIDLDRLVEAGNWLSAQLGVRNESRVGRAIWARRVARERADREKAREESGKEMGKLGGQGIKGEEIETEDGM